MANTYSAIATVTVGSGGASSIAFSSIPNTYTDLLLMISVRDSQSGASANDNSINFNGSATSFTGRRLLGNGASASSDTVAPYSGSSVGAGATTSTFSNTSIYIPNYASSTNKSFSIDTVTESNISGADKAYGAIYAGLWSNTSAINAISIIRPASGFDFAQYSTATLFGIKSS